MIARHGNPRDHLVQLQLVDLMNTTPPPERSVQGQIARTLKNVGSNKRFAVRARMITLVSDTKYKTFEDWPISLVGLHGKGEILALGPAWAIERLGEGIASSFDDEVSVLREELQLYRDLAALASKPIGETSLSRPRYRNSRMASAHRGPWDIKSWRDELPWLVTRASRTIDGWDAGCRHQAMTFIDGVIFRLQAFIEECDAGGVPWYFFWTTGASAKRAAIGTSPRQSGLEADLFFHFKVPSPST